MEKPSQHSNLLARAFGIRDVFKVVLLGKVRENRAIRQPARLRNVIFCILL